MVTIFYYDNRENVHGKFVQPLRKIQNSYRYTTICDFLLGSFCAKVNFNISKFQLEYNYPSSRV
jgi:hypothetical protein